MLIISAVTLEFVPLAIYAQVVQDENPEQRLEEIVVTGSRITRQDPVSAPTPVTVVSPTELLNARPGNLAQALVELPELMGSVTTQSATISVGAGAISPNLRAVGAQRTLTLLDGRRLPPYRLQGGSNLNIIPLNLIKRVDVVTGGASAAYGSDAVSGVINFVLDTTFEGLDGEVNGGITSQGDKGNYHASLAAGTGFAGGRGHIVGSVDYYNDDGLMFEDRRWLLDHWSVITVPGVTAATASPSNPFRILARDVVLSNASYGGLITSGPLQGIQFGPGGVPTSFTYGQYVTGATMSGGEGANPSDFGNLYAPQTRSAAFTHVIYDLTDAVSVYGEAGYNTSKVTINSFANWENGVMHFEIPVDNYYLPQSIRDQMIALGLQSFPMGRVSPDFGALGGPTTSELIRAVGGVKANFGAGWSLDAYYAHAKNTQKMVTYNDSKLEDLFMAADTVVDPATGGPICWATLNNPTSTDPSIQDCVPINLFGPGAPSQEALDYVLGTEIDHINITQDVVALTVNGEPFTSWAGPVQVAFGGEYRKEKASMTSDDIAASFVSNAGIRTMPASLNGKRGGYNLTNMQPNSGSFDVKEAFVEVQLPLARDVTMARSLDFNAAGRYAEYSHGGGVNSWKAGFVYQPITGLRLRATQSRDVRAANVNELFAPGAGTGLGITDPFRNNEQVLGGTTFTTGNPDLTPEKADTTVVGFTVAPTWLPDFTGSVDWFSIDIKDAIASLGAQNIVNQCFLGATYLCPLIHRGPDGVINLVENPTLNAASSKASGLDIELNYRTPASNIISSWRGDLSLRLFASHLGKLETKNLGAAPVDRAGDIRFSQTPEWSAQLIANYASDRLGAYIRQRWIGPGKYNALWGPNDVDNNHVDSQLYTDLTVRYSLRGESNTEVYFTINNVFDNMPQKTGYLFVVGTQPIGKSLYDQVGRAYSLGFSFRM